MELTERTHAFLAARYYVRLKERFQDRGVQAFRLAVRYYAEQRGRRMAQRATADGQPLTYAVYRRYGEWVNTETTRSRHEENRSDPVSAAPDYEVHVRQCPWHAEFRDLGLPEAGVAYCSILDESICRGFNPEIRYKTLQTLHDHAYCIQRVTDSGLTEEDLQAVKRRDGLKSFAYHCAHTYWSFREIVTGVFGEEGRETAEAVLNDLGESWGEEAVRTVLQFEGTDFNVNTPEPAEAGRAG